MESPGAPCHTATKRRPGVEKGACLPGTPRICLKRLNCFLPPQARYKQSLDPTVDEVKKLCTSLRRNAKEERVLFHYNGHGVPRPTVNGEIWVFNKVRRPSGRTPGPARPGRRNSNSCLLVSSFYH